MANSPLGEMGNENMGKHFQIHFLQTINLMSAEMIFEAIVGKTKRGRPVKAPIRYPDTSLDCENLPHATSSSAQPHTKLAVTKGKRKNAHLEQDDFNRTRRKSNTDFQKVVDKYIENVEVLQNNEERCKIELDQARLKATRDEANLGYLRGENKRIREDLEAFKRKAVESAEASDLLKIDILKQQPASQLPDSEIVKKYEHLGEAISSWVDDEVAIFNETWRKRNSGYPEAHQFHDGGSRDYRRFLRAGFRLGGEYLLQSVIRQEIYKELFSDTPTFFGLDIPEQVFLRRVEEGLRKLDPPRNPAAIRYVRSEALKGFVQSDLFQKSCFDFVPIIGKTILDRVDTILPGLQDYPNRAQLLCDRVVQPAVDLATARETSATFYSFSSPLTPETWFGKSLLPLHEFNKYEMIDVNTGGVIKKRNIATEDAIEQVLLLAPGLVRCDPGMPQKHLTLTIICVKVIHPKAVSSGNSDRESSDPITTSPVTVNEPQSQENLQISDEVGRSPRVDTAVQSSISKGKFRAEMRNPIINKHLGLTKVVYGTAESNDLTTDGTSHPDTEESDDQLDAKEIAKGEELSQLPARAGKKRMLGSPSRAGTFQSDAGGEDDWSRLGKIEQD
ncbi:MAG: hypothetical protein LQ344_005919 [Seirophora lacunosa]|nr:MAG: hypothetical protein LQ344_005919 [Seirophora lacunosa]